MVALEISTLIDYCSRMKQGMGNDGQRPCTSTPLSPELVVWGTSTRRWYNPTIVLLSDQESPKCVHALVLFLRPWNCCACPVFISGNNNRAGTQSSRKGFLFLCISIVLHTLERTGRVAGCGQRTCCSVQGPREADAVV